MSEARRPLPAPSYPDLLRTAYALGRADGLLAAEFEPLQDAGTTSGCCRGRDPADFARHLWNLPDADPPAGLEVNAPHWYAHGFQEALAGRVVDQCAVSEPPQAGSTVFTMTQFFSPLGRS